MGSCVAKAQKAPNLLRDKNLTHPPEPQQQAQAAVPAVAAQKQEIANQQSQNQQEKRTIPLNESYLCSSQSEHRGAANNADLQQVKRSRLNQYNNKAKGLPQYPSVLQQQTSPPFNPEQSPGQQLIQPPAGYRLVWNKATPCAQVYDFGKGTIRHTSSEFNRYQIVSQHPFPTEGSHGFTVRILKQRPQRAICVGFITEARINEESSGDIGDQQSVGFWTYTSGKCQIDVDGECAPANRYEKDRLGCAESGSFRISLNRFLDRVKIEREANERQPDTSFCYIPIPKQWRTMNLYPFVSMIQKDDQIETTYQRIK